MRPRPNAYGTRDALILSVLFGIVLSALTACAPRTEAATNAAHEQPYAIRSLEPYDRAACTSIGNGPGGFDTGLNITLKDDGTAETLDGRVAIATEEGETGIRAGEYACEEGTAARSALVTAYAQGYAPVTFIVEYPRAQLATVDVRMKKSCSGGPSFFDNLETAARAKGNRTMGAVYVEENKQRLYAILKERFGLEEGKYGLECVEGNLGRGGYVKATGRDKDNSSFALSYHWGWCSSGGGDCGWSECFSTEASALFASVKDATCGRLSSRQSHYEPFCLGDEYDHTEDVRAECFAGGFELAQGATKTLSIVQSANRCGSDVSVGAFDCLAT